MKRQAKIRQTLVRLALAWAMAVACMMSAPRARAQAEEGSDALVPKAVELSAAAQAAINAEFLSEEEKRDLRIAHGVWTDADLDTAARRAAAALQIWDLGAEAQSDPAIPAELRAEAMLRRGNLEEAAATASTSGSARAARIRCEALLLLGKFAEADEALTATLQAAGHGDIKSADELTEAARCLALRARLRGEGGGTYQATMGMLGEVSQRLDRMHPGAKLAEGQLLYEKDNTEDAVKALHEALGLNPQLSQAWYQLGLIALDTYDFGSADDAIAALRAVNSDHPLATLLAVRAALVQNMPDEAAKTLGPMREKYPAMREAMALTAAIAATRYDQAGMAQALADMEAISPGSGYGHATAGHFLAGNRQYDLAATTLREAIRRESGWATPQIDLGLMLVQAARDDEARQVLGRVAELDPFNEAARFSLKLLNDISAYAVIETPHFVIRYDPQTTDGLLAEEMKAPLEKIYSDITGVFGHEPAQKTVIELQPNHARFAVRITGMPELHTIAASTGPLIAVESPRAGAGHFGLFDWARVVRHEYVHTVNLSHTNNRIPHWLTEAAAVWQESAPRDERTCLMLVQAYETDRLFDLDEINWAFVRPKRAGDRGLAYAQGHWMFEYMVETFGLDRMRALMGEYAKGQPEAAALPAALGVTREAFFEGFMAWAPGKLEEWGYHTAPTMEAMLAEIHGEQIPPSLSAEDVDGLLERYPSHPDLLEAKIEMLQAGEGLTEGLVPWLLRYSAARPAAMVPHELQAQLLLNEGQGAAAIAHLEELDKREQYRPLFAVELANQYRAQGKYEEALGKMRRALGIDPFNATFRELAAAIAIQAKDYAEARRHITALTALEPDRLIHKQRLEALGALEAKAAPTPDD